MGTATFLFAALVLAGPGAGTAASPRPLGTKARFSETVERDLDLPHLASRDVAFRLFGSLPSFDKDGPSYGIWSFGEQNICSWTVIEPTDDDRALLHAIIYQAPRTDPKTSELRLEDAVAVARIVHGTLSPEEQSLALHSNDLSIRAGLRRPPSGTERPEIERMLRVEGLIWATDANGGLAKSRYDLGTGFRLSVMQPVDGLRFRFDGVNPCDRLAVGFDFTHATWGWRGTLPAK